MYPGTPVWLEVLASVETGSAFADQTRTATCRRRWRCSPVRPDTQPVASRCGQAATAGSRARVCGAPRTTPGAFRLSEAGTRIGRRGRVEACARG